MAIEYVKPPNENAPQFPLGNNAETFSVPPDSTALLLDGVEFSADRENYPNYTALPDQLSNENTLAILNENGTISIYGKVFITEDVVIDSIEQTINKVKWNRLYTVTEDEYIIILEKQKKLKFAVSEEGKLALRLESGVASIDVSEDLDALASKFLITKLKSIASADFAHYFSNQFSQSALLKAFSIINKDKFDKDEGDCIVFNCKELSKNHDFVEQLTQTFKAQTGKSLSHEEVIEILKNDYTILPTDKKNNRGIAFGDLSLYGVSGAGVIPPSERKLVSIVLFCFNDFKNNHHAAK